jgi:calcineurin-like phosphoesterase family protein
MKIAIIADIHHGNESLTCPDLRDAEWPVLSAVDQFIDRAIAEQADVVLELGDRINDFDHERDWRHASEIAPAFKRFPRERVHLLGNHDAVNLSAAENEAILECSLQSRVVDLGVARLVAWQPGVVFDYGIGSFPRASDHLGWLVETLLADERPAIVATHVSLAGRAQTGNYYHHHAPTYSTYPDQAEVREAVEKTGRVALWLAGHSHWNTLTTIGNIHHITVQSLTERFTTFPKTAGAYADLLIEDGKFALDVRGNDPFYIRLPFRKSGDQPWVPPIYRR